MYTKFLHCNEWKHIPILRWTRYLIMTQVINTIRLNEGDDVNPEKKIKDKLIFDTINIIIVYSLKCLYF